MAIADRAGLPVAIDVASASPAEVCLVDTTLASRFTRRVPRRLIGDKAYDSDPLDRRLRRRRIALIAPHKRNRRRPPTQDGRGLRRYCRRWKVERLFAWLHQFRRVVVRYEYHAGNYLGLLQLACIVILLRNYL
jgi:transposase